METVFYILASLATILLMVATVRALVLMDRMEQTRKDLSTLIAESTLTMQHANRMLARMQESVERIRHAVDRIEKVMAMLQPSNAFNGIIAGARRVFSGARQGTSSADESAEKETNHG